MSSDQAETAGPGLAALARTLRDWQPQMPEGRFAGRGIVIAAGGAAMFTNAYVLLSILRKTLGCTLPIEIWHFGASELSPAMADLLRPFDVELVDAIPLIAATGATVRDGWQLKPFAMLWSRFAEVLLLDADQVPVSDPAPIFDWPEYRDAGAVFWPDVVDLRAANPVWDRLGLAPRRTASFESGQVLVDKRRHWRALSIVLRLNDAADELYQLIYGDKDAFLLGWELAAAPFALVPHRPFTDERYFAQRDFSGAPLFQHRTNAKWAHGQEQLTLDGFQHADACLAALAALQAAWGGNVFHAPDRTLAARETERGLAGTAFDMAIGDTERLTLALLPYGEIGAGRSHDRPNWWCEEQEGAIVLCIGTIDQLSYRLTRTPDGDWHGTRLRLPPARASLTYPTTQPPHRPAPGLVAELLRAADGPADRTALSAALTLLARIEPGIAAQLRALAADERDPARRALLDDLATATGGDIILGAPNRDETILTRHYHRTFDDDVG